MPHQVAITIAAPVADGHASELTKALTELGAEPKLPFDDLPGLHFARLFILQETKDLGDSTIPAQLVLLSDVDSPASPYLPALVEAFGDMLDDVFGHCAGYPAAGERTASGRVAFLRSHQVRAAAAYINTVGRSLDQVHHEAALRDAIEDFLDRSPDLRSRTAASIREETRTFVFDEDSLAWARRPAEKPELWWRIKELIHMIVPPLILVLLLPLVLVGLVVWVIALRIHERRDVPEHDPPPDPDRLELLTAMEDHVVQNPFTAIGLVKRGSFRLWTLRSVLAAVSYGIRHVFNHGKLSGIRTIHFARWVFIDDRRRLFFASNYDGSMESYMDDFIDKVAWGLNAVFSNGRGYPRTNWLVRDGAKDEQTFKNYLRAHQVVTPVWYSAYPGLTAVNVENNAAIRAGLYGDMTNEEAAAWLRRL
jgi:hypothetical protein